MLMLSQRSNIIRKSQIVNPTKKFGGVRIDLQQVGFPNSNASGFYLRAIASPVNSSQLRVKELRLETLAKSKTPHKYPGMRLNE